MTHDISGLDKAKLLIALYDNAKNSAWTKGTLRNMPFLSGQKLELSEEKARQLLSNNSYIDYVGPVLIKTSFSGDTIDTSSYDRDHHGNGGAKLAGDVISELRVEHSASCKI
ncbi:hypothetical protein ACNVED_08210 [Legionella sp. D16C41]|uniref:hypothetical protein n=1 Tax=Legionella sp. D16C41 TaxID=3402688 RepID=UPI003AF9F7EF